MQKTFDFHTVKLPVHWNLMTKNFLFKN